MATRRVLSSLPRTSSRRPSKQPGVFSRSQLYLIRASGVAAALDLAVLPQQWQLSRSLSYLLTPHSSTGTTNASQMPSSAHVQHSRYPCSPMITACFASEANKDNEGPTETVKELYEKLTKSIEAKSSPPNAWLWSLVENCANEEDIGLLFQTLQNFRRFRLSALRINADFNSHLCERVSEACARVGAFDYGLKALWKHNIYGLTPSIASAHHLLRVAKEKNDYILMGRIMRVLQKNSLPLQPGTADIIFSICSNTNKWDLISIYSRKFIKAGVKLHQTTFDIWMEFTAHRGDAASIWKIDKLRSNSSKQHTLSSAFSCAKGFLLEHKPESAAAIIHALNQNLSDKKKPNIAKELQKLVDWPSEVVKRQKGDTKALASSLSKDISEMVDSLMNMGLEVMVNLERLEHTSGTAEGKLAA